MVVESFNEFPNYPLDSVIYSKDNIENHYNGAPVALGTFCNPFGENSANIKFPVFTNEDKAAISVYFSEIPSLNTPQNCVSRSGLRESFLQHNGSSISELCAGETNFGKLASILGAGDETDTAAPPRTSPNAIDQSNYAVPKIDDSTKEKNETKPKEVKKRRKRKGENISARRERNRVHAQRSRNRKQALIDSLQESAILLKEENEKLRAVIRTDLGEEALIGIQERSQDNLEKSLPVDENEPVDEKKPVTDYQTAAKVICA